MKIVALAASLALGATAAVAESGADFTDYSVGYWFSSDMPGEGVLSAAGSFGYSNGNWQYSIGGIGMGNSTGSVSVVTGTLGYEILPSVLLHGGAELYNYNVSVFSPAPASHVFYNIGVDYEAGNIGVGFNYNPPQNGDSLGYGEIYGLYDLANGNAINVLTYFATGENFMPSTTVGYSHWNGLYGYSAALGFSGGSDFGFMVGMNHQLTSRIDGSLGLSGYSGGDYFDLRAGVDYTLNGGNRLQMRYNQSFYNGSSSNSFIELNYVHTFGDKRPLEQRVMRNLTGPYEPPLYFFGRS